MPEEEKTLSLNGDDEKIVRPQKIYIKDASFESPNSPELFNHESAPKLSVEMKHSASVVEDDLYEVVLAVTATVTMDDKTAFLAEVHQAGIFVLKGLEPDILDTLLNVYCLRTLYPYACTVLSDMVGRGGFPQLLLAPISFSGLYKQKLQDASSQGEAADE